MVWLVFSASQGIAGQCRATRALAGDLLEITCNGQKSIIRLAGIDAPEMPSVEGGPGQPCCERARLHLAELVSSQNVQTVSMEIYGRDRYNRTLAVVFVRDLNVNLEMVKAGLAEVYRGMLSEGFDLTAYRNTEQKARRALLGIWVLRDQYFSPKDWREIYEKHTGNR